MTGEVPHQPGDDQTTGVIYDVIHTMDGEGSAEVPAKGPTAATPPPAPAENMRQKVAVDLPAEHTNADLEKRLVNKGVFGKRSINQRRVLGCLGCKLACQPEDTGAVRSLEIAECLDAENLSVRRVLGRLTEAGFLRTEKRPSSQKGTPPDYFLFTQRSVDFSFKRRLQAPATCGLEQESNRQPNAEAESLLVSEGVFQTKGAALRTVLGCLGCRLQKDEGVYPRGVQRCSGLANSQPQLILQRLERAGILEAEHRTGVAAGGHRTDYTFTDTELARKVKKRLDVPEYCGLEGKKDINGSTEPK
jgi:predicted transcriptional regulator